MSPISRVAIARFGLAGGLVLSSGICSYLIATGDEPRRARLSNRTPLSNRTQPVNTPADAAESVSKPDQPSASDSEQAQRSPADALRSLSDLELAAIARGKNLSKDLAAKLGVTDEQFAGLLLEELGRRWEKVARVEKASTPQPSNGTSPKPIAPDAAARRSEQPEQQRDTKPSQQDPSQADVASEAAVASETVTTLNSPDPKTALPLNNDLPVEITATLGNAFDGTPMGVGELEVRFDEGRGPILYPDTPLRLQDPSGRTRYATFQVAYEKDEPRSRTAGWPAPRYQASRVTVRFLISGDAPLELKLFAPEQEWKASLDVKVIPSVHDRQALMRQWWDRFSKLPDDLDPRHRVLRETFLDCLASRHGLPGPWPSNRRDEGKSPQGLEGQFERAIGMLFGIESVKLAMQDNVTLRETTRTETADQPVPKPRAMRSLNVPSFQPGWIEPLAMHVPEECFYLRTGNVTNYRYFRGFLKGWGGNLDDVVSGGTVDPGIREKVEFQLGLPSDGLKSKAIDRSISDMALIGLDPFFGDGAALGVLFQAEDSLQLRDELRKLRGHYLVSFDDVKEQRLTLGTSNVSFLHSDDHRVRSYYAINGAYHLITNSETLLRRFFEAGRGNRSLGRLREYQYTRSKLGKSRNQVAFLYLSDPFFRNLVSPHYRIEMTRRSRALRELRQFKLAHLMARAEGIAAGSVDDLVDAKYLPPAFAKRADHSQPQRSSGRYQDSLRGIPGAFLPIPDVPVAAATATEVSSYRLFIERYARQWRRVDPVAVAFSRTRNPDRSGNHHIGLDIFVTPYATQRYATLARHLAEPTRHQLSSIPGNLLTVQAAVRLNSHSAPHLLSIGLQDDNVAFAIEDGQVRLLGEAPGASFAKTRTYAALNPPGNDVLRMLASILLDQKLPAPQPAKPMARRLPFTPPPPVPFSSAVPQVGQAFYYFAWALGSQGPKIANAVKAVQLIETKDDLTVVSMDNAIRRKAIETVTEQRKWDGYRARLSMNSLEGSAVEPYIQAYTYMQARSRSSDNAELLNDFSQWLDLEPHESKKTVEQLIRGKLLCPAGGQLELSVDKKDPIAGVPTWRGTTWEENSRYATTEIPTSWKYPFLDWLRGMDLKFHLDALTLQADVELLIRENEMMRANLKARPLKMTDREITTLAAKPEITPPRNLAATTTTQDWILGVRIPQNQSPIRVLDVYNNSPASASGIRIGDLIESVNGRSPKDGNDLRRLMAAVQKNGVVSIRIRRNGTSQTLRLTLSRGPLTALTR